MSQTTRRAPRALHGLVTGLLCASSACGGAAERSGPGASALAAAPVSVRVVFDPGDGAAAAGNLLLLRSERLAEEGTPRPGPALAYGSSAELARAVQLAPGTQLSLPVPQGRGFVCAYLDTRREFMQNFGVGEGGYWSSRCASAAQVDGGDAVLRLDRRVPPSDTVLQASLAGDHVVRAELPGGPLQIPLLVFLPPDYESSAARYPVLYLFHGFGGGRFNSRPEVLAFRERMAQAGSHMIIAVIEGNGRFGPHLFVNSEANGPLRDALLEHVIPWVDRSFRTRAEPSARVAFGHSSGGWVALSLLLEHPEVIGFAFSSSPDPLHLATWWQEQAGNAYRGAAGEDNLMLDAPGQLSVSMREFVQREVQTGSFGQFAAFLSVFSPYRPGREPFPFELPFDLESGDIDPAIWQEWEKRDLYLATARDPVRARRALAGRLFLYAGKRDEFGLAETTAEYSRLLDQLQIPHEFELRDAGHFADEGSKAFRRGIWDRAWQAVSEARSGE
jgi:pimeloyl-ACP methyl ester carboxylesterase